MCDKRGPRTVKIGNRTLVELPEERVVVVPINVSRIPGGEFADGGGLTLFRAMEDMRVQRITVTDTAMHGRRSYQLAWTDGTDANRTFVAFNGDDGGVVEYPQADALYSSAEHQLTAAPGLVFPKHVQRQFKVFHLPGWGPVGYTVRLTLVYRPLILAA